MSSSLVSSTKPLPQDPDSLLRAMQDTMPRTRNRPLVAKQSFETARQNRMSTMTVKSQKISDKRSSTQTIASLFIPRDKVEKSKKKGGKTGRTAKMKNMIPSLPAMPK